jgi:hypothetical protein
MRNSRKENEVKRETEHSTRRITRKVEGVPSFNSSGRFKRPIFNKT